MTESENKLKNCTCSKIAQVQKDLHAKQRPNDSAAIVPAQGRVFCTCQVTLAIILTNIFTSNNSPGCGCEGPSLAPYLALKNTLLFNTVVSITFRGRGLHARDGRGHSQKMHKWVIILNSSAANIPKALVQPPCPLQRRKVFTPRHTNRCH